MEIKRSYDHRGGKGKEGFGHIGDVNLVVPDGVWKVNGHAIPVESVEYLANFALQAFQDAYAGADTRETAISEFTKRVTRVIEGTIGVRGNAGAPMDDASKLARSLAKEDIKRRAAEVTEKKKVEEWAADERTSKYFKKATNGWTWNDAAVEIFIDAMKAQEIRDYRAEAEKQIADSQAIVSKITL